MLLRRNSAQIFSHYRVKDSLSLIELSLKVTELEKHILYRVTKIYRVKKGLKVTDLGSFTEFDMVTEFEMVTELGTFLQSLRVWELYRVTRIFPRRLSSMPRLPS